MKDITQNFGTLYHPQSALVFYTSKGSRSDTYVEHFDMDKNGMPINAHSLTVREANLLVKALKITDENKEPILKFYSLTHKKAKPFGLQKGCKENYIFLKN